MDDLPADEVDVAEHRIAIQHRGADPLEATRASLRFGALAVPAEDSLPAGLQMHLSVRG